jgi:hypothetical protein
MLFNFIDLSARIDLIFRDGLKAEPLLKIIKRIVSFNEVPANSVVRILPHEY